MVIYSRELMSVMKKRRIILPKPVMEVPPLRKGSGCRRNLSLVISFLCDLVREFMALLHCRLEAFFICLMKRWRGC